MLKRTNRAADWPEYLYSWAVEPRCSLTHSSADFSGISTSLLSHKQNKNNKNQTNKQQQQKTQTKTTRALFNSLPFLSFALSPSGCPCKSVTHWCWHFSYGWLNLPPICRNPSFPYLLWPFSISTTLSLRCCSNVMMFPRAKTCSCC